jgi:hypothetical protein
LSPPQTFATRKLTALGCPQGEDQRSESQSSSQIGTARAEKHTFRTETRNVTDGMRASTVTYNDASLSMILRR